MSVKGEKYASKKAMMKHEKTEPMSQRKMEYGSKSSKKVAKKVVSKPATKMYGSMTAMKKNTKRGK